MAVLDQDLGDLHRVQRAIGGVVAKAFARERSRVFLSGCKVAPVQGIRSWRGYKPEPRPSAQGGSGPGMAMEAETIETVRPLGSAA
jgi:hypothetical protein